jgi:hypothetical protein
MHGRSGGSGEPARVNASSNAWFGLGLDPRRALGQRPSVPHQQGQEVFYVDAALVGCGHALSQLRVHVWTAPGIESRSAAVPCRTKECYSFRSEATASGARGFSNSRMMRSGLAGVDPICCFARTRANNSALDAILSLPPNQRATAPSQPQHAAAGDLLSRSSADRMAFNAAVPARSSTSSAAQSNVR